MRSIRANWSDLVVAVLLVLTLGTIALAQIGRSQETANRVKCASNLRQIGQAILLYSNDNRGAYPRTIADIKNPTPTWGTPYEGNDALKKPLPDKQADPFDAKNSQVMPKANDVTAAMFMLLRTQDITSSVFVCPSTGLHHWDLGGGKNTAMNWTNWPGKDSLAEHLSYSYQNPYPTSDAVKKGWKFNNAIGAEVAIAADMNPGVDALLKISVNSPAADMRKGNSANHNFDGINALFGDGHVEWDANPFVGVKRDNIYTFGESGSDHADKGGDGIVGSSIGPEDSVLLPTAKDLGVLDAEGKLSEAAQKQRAGAVAAMKPVTPAEQEATRAKIPGTYKSAGPGNATLKITEDKIEVTGDKAATFSFKFAGLDRTKAVMNLMSPSDPTTITGKAVVLVKPDGITISGPAEITGQWKRQ